MIIVSEESIDKAHQLFEDLDEKEAREMAHRFSMEQPYLMTFVQAMASLSEEDVDTDEYQEFAVNEALQEGLNYYAIFIWKAFEFEAGTISTITDQEIQEQSVTSMDDLQALISVSESGDVERTNQHFQNLPQPVLFAYLLTELFGDFDDPEFDEDFTDENANYIFLISNQIIQMLDQKVNGGKLKIVS